MYPMAPPDPRDRSLPTLPMPLRGEQSLLLILTWAAIAQRLVGAFHVIPYNPLPNGGARVGKTPKLVLPHTLLLEGAKPPLDESILFRRIRRNKLLRQPVKPTRVPKAPTLKGLLRIFGDP
jgi:hypothetical protein